MPEFQPFLMERLLSKFEQVVDFNMSESGVHPIALRDLVCGDDARIERLLDTDLNYPHVNGIPELREKIAELYNGATADNVLVTVGASEANYLSVRTLLNAGDEITVMLPNYMQVWGIAKNHGLRVRTFRLCEAEGWAADVSELREKVTANTKLIAVCNPNNPTGHALSDGEMDAIIDIAASSGAWILADEVYRGAERTMEGETPSFYGRYGKVLAVGGLSKAYGLPGLRLGWVVGPAGIIDDIWARHEYVTISATMLANQLACIALSADVRPRLIARARAYVRKGYATLQNWLEKQDGPLRITGHDAAAIAFARYDADMRSTEFAEKLRQRKSVLLVPGEHFGMDRFVRISFGAAQVNLESALERIYEFMEELKG